jgi:VanZ family protein
MSQLRLLVRYFLPACFYIGGLVYLSLKPADEFPFVPFPHFDKFVHFVLYTGLGAVLVRMFYNWRLFGSELRQKMAAFLVAIAYAALDEQIQRFSPGRHPSLADFIFDCLGAITGAFLLPYYVWLRSRIFSSGK